MLNYFKEGYYHLMNNLFATDVADVTRGENELLVLLGGRVVLILVFPLSH